MQSVMDSILSLSHQQFTCSISA